MVDKIVRIKLEGGSAISDANRTNRAVKGVGTSADRASSSLFNMSKVATALIAALGASKLTQYADSWTSINNQIKQATKTTVEALAVQEAIFQIAKESRVELQGVADAYQRISNSVADYGFGAKESLDVVEGLTKAFKANGATAQEVSSVLVQLGQGLGSSALQGEELKAILEASLPVSRALAKEFGVTVGELKELGAAGKLTTERVFVALQNALPEFESAFDKANKTISEGITVAGNSMTRLVGLTNEATGAGNSLANGLIDLSSAIDFLGDAVESGAAGKIADVFRQQLQQISNDVTATTNYIFDSWENTGGAIQASIGATASFIGNAFLNIIPNVRNMVQVITVEIASTIDKLKAYGVAVGELLNPFNDVSAEQARDAFHQTLSQIDSVRESSLQSIFDQRHAEQVAQEQRLTEADDLMRKYQEQRNARKLSLGSGGIGGASQNRNSADDESGNSTDSGGEDVTAKLERENQMIQQSLLNRQNIYSNFFAAANDLTATEYERQQAQLSLNLATEMQRENEAFQARLQAITDRQLAIAENKSLNDEQKREADALLNEQAILARQQFENRITEISQEGAARRAQIDQQEAVNKINTYQGYANTALSLATAFGSKSEKQNKKNRRNAVKIDTAAGIARAFAENDFYTALGMSGLIAANGIKQIKAIDSAGQPSANLASGVTSPQPSQSSNASSQQQARRIVDLRGFGDGGFLTKDQLTALLEGDEDVILANNNGQAQGSRVGLI